MSGAPEKPQDGLHEAKGLDTQGGATASLSAPQEQSTSPQRGVAPPPPAGTNPWWSNTITVNDVVYVPLAEADRRLYAEKQRYVECFSAYTSLEAQRVKLLGQLQQTDLKVGALQDLVGLDAVAAEIIRAYTAFTWAGFRAGKARRPLPDYYQREHQRRRGDPLHEVWYCAYCKRQLDTGHDEDCPIGRFLALAGYDVLIEAEASDG